MFLQGCREGWLGPRTGQALGRWHAVTSFTPQALSAQCPVLRLPGTLGMTLTLVPVSTHEIVSSVAQFDDTAGPHSAWVDA